jgi:hypothetical protein
MATHVPAATDERRRALAPLGAALQLIPAFDVASAAPDARISPCVPKGGPGTDRQHAHTVPVVPHIVRPAALHGPDLRAELGIPPDATVFGRHGGYETFDIPFVREVVFSMASAARASAMHGTQSADTTSRASRIYYVLMNTPAFCDPLPNIIHLPCALRTPAANACG